MRFGTLLLLVGCGISEEDFATQFASDQCAWAATCASATTAAAPLEGSCEDALVATVTALNNDATCTYDAGAAADCLDAVAATACDNGDAIAAACDGVFTGEACNLTFGDYL